MTKERIEKYEEYIIRRFDKAVVAIPKGTRCFWAPILGSYADLDTDVAFKHVKELIVGYDQFSKMYPDAKSMEEIEEELKG